MVNNLDYPSMAAMRIALLRRLRGRTGVMSGNLGGRTIGTLPSARGFVPPSFTPPAFTPPRAQPFAFSEGLWPARAMEGQGVARALGVLLGTRRIPTREELTTPPEMR